MLDESYYTIIKYSDKSTVFEGRRKYNVYKINFSDLADQKVVYLPSMSDEKWTWHKILGHANWRFTSKFSKLKLFKDLNQS